MKAKVTLKNYLTLPDGFYTAAPNLLYVVRGNTRRFVFRYMVDGKRRDKSIGPVSKVDLTQAKSTAKEFLGRLASGLPLTQSTKERLAEEYSRAEIPSFKSFAEQTIEKIKEVKRWRSNKTYANTVQYFNSYVYPVIGNKRIDEIKRADVVA
ncbi:Arm DNA-binding domain-containing protein, partial [uncultured Parasutterella sp.]